MKLLHRFFSRFLRSGRLTVTDAGGVTRGYGDGMGGDGMGGDGMGGGGAPVRISLHSRMAEWRLLLSPMLAAGELYMEGLLTVDEGTLHDFLSLAGRNAANLDRFPLLRLLRRLEAPLRHLRTFNPTARARKNAAHHYDLSDTLYELFLDEERHYSCAYFRHDDDTLEQAQRNKQYHIAAKLLLDRPGLRVLDIGCGWGGMALFLARRYDCEVDGITLSKEQHKLANERAASAGLAGRVRFHLRDYRRQRGVYDRIVSIGMFEHVGSGHYREFFARARELLADGGVMLLHSIGTMGAPTGTNPWIRKYIFPGGYTPALSETLAAVERGRLYVTDLEIWRRHYARTLAAWAERFAANRGKVKALYDERFCRMWEFYLNVCRVAFEEMEQMVFQLQLAKDNTTVPLLRDYVSEAWRRFDAE